MAKSNTVYGITISGIREECSFGGVNCSRHYLHDVKKKANAASEAGLTSFGTDEVSTSTISAEDYVKSVYETDAAKQAAADAERQRGWDERMSDIKADENIAKELSQLEFSEQAPYGGLPSVIAISNTQYDAYQEDRRLTSEELKEITGNALKLVAGIESGAFPANDELRAKAKWVREELYNPKNLSKEGKPKLPLKEATSWYGDDTAQVPESIDRLTSGLRVFSSQNSQTANAFSSEIEKRTGRPSVIVPPIKGLEAFTNLFRRNR